jgi:hypothetical protein
MNELVYLMRVAEDDELFEKIAVHLQVKEIPHWVRVSTLAPLSTFGYGPGAEGAILTWTDAGITYGLVEDPTVPRVFVPWQNIAYIAEGDAAVEEWAREQQATEEPEASEES